eukprot:9317312-Prorocentrum_lima.AAC.1
MMRRSGSTAVCCLGRLGRLLPRLGPRAPGGGNLILERRHCRHHCCKTRAARCQRFRSKLRQPA